MIGVTVLGSTGSIGISTLDVIARHSDRYRVIALTANRNVDILYQQCRAMLPEYAVMADSDSARELARRVAAAGLSIEVLAGMEGLELVAGLSQVEQVMAAIVGAAGLLPTLAAVRAGKRILLANKEALVVSGQLFMDEAKKYGAKILPIDSEHNAVFQCLPAGFEHGLEQAGVRRILLTASGGPFRDTPLERLESVTPDQACSHPTWDMGRKISVDSATMMNKGLEVVEACWLFNTLPRQVQVVLHPQSVIHSMVEYADGSVLAQLGNPDMRTPIAHALGWPQRIDSGVASLDLFQVARLEFEAPDLKRFPCLGIAYDVIEAGGTAPAIMNAANEVAVAAFLQGRLKFTAIPQVIDGTLSAMVPSGVSDLQALLEVDLEARSLAEQMITDPV
jgi:1-deoxy-D-xylulose-5-phosphate reductoisomerase